MYGVIRFSPNCDTIVHMWLQKDLVMCYQMLTLHIFCTLQVYHNTYKVVKEVTKCIANFICGGKSFNNTCSLFNKCLMEDQNLWILKKKSKVFRIKGYLLEIHRDGKLHQVYFTTLIVCPNIFLYNTNIHFTKIHVFKTIGQSFKKQIY